MLHENISFTFIHVNLDLNYRGILKYVSLLKYLCLFSYISEEIIDFHLHPAIWIHTYRSGKGELTHPLTTVSPGSPTWAVGRSISCHCSFRLLPEEWFYFPSSLIPQFWQCSHFKIILSNQKGLTNPAFHVLYRKLRNSLLGQIAIL